MAAVTEAEEEETTNHGNSVRRRPAVVSYERRAHIVITYFVDGAADTVENPDGGARPTETDANIIDCLVFFFYSRYK